MNGGSWPVLNFPQRRRELPLKIRVPVRQRRLTGGARVLTLSATSGCSRPAAFGYSNLPCVSGARFGSGTLVGSNKEIVSLQMGNVEVRSEGLGKGSEFIPHSAAQALGCAARAHATDPG